MQAAGNPGTGTGSEYHGGRKRRVNEEDPVSDFYFGTTRNMCHVSLRCLLQFVPRQCFIMCTDILQSRILSVAKDFRSIVPSIQLTFFVCCCCCYCLCSYLKANKVTYKNKPPRKSVHHRKRQTRRYGSTPARSPASKQDTDHPLPSLPTRPATHLCPVGSLRR